MAKELKTGWVCLATSGTVTHGKEDGRVIEQQWLNDMAESFNSKLHTPMIYPDHRRYWTFGKVLALKVEPATEPELEGEIKLFGIIAPNDSFIAANKQGEYLFPSIEVGEDFRGTGKYFLKGLGATNEPASVGVTELKFNKKDKAIVFAGEQFNVCDELDESDKDTLIKRIFSNIYPKTTDNQSEQDDMSKQALEALQKEFTALKEEVAALVAKDSGASDEGEESVVTAEQFSALKDQVQAIADQLEGGDAADEASSAFTALKDKLESLDKKFQAAISEAGDSTDAGGDETDQPAKVF